jgi:hypothetical protein
LAVTAALFCWALSQGAAQSQTILDLAIANDKSMKIFMRIKL